LHPEPRWSVISREHGITATFETVKIGGSSIGKVLETYVKVHAIDLLVMGAYRHSRLNEFVWAGRQKQS